MEDNILALLKKELPHIQQQVLLKDHTTFGIGGPAHYFLVAREVSHVSKAINLAKKHKLPVFVFGGGSNLLVSDEGIVGLVIKIQNSEIVVKKNTITVGAGADMKDVVEASLVNSLEGIEWAGGLPGTFGGAIRGNAGAFGCEMKDSIFQVKALDKKLKLHTLNNKQCQFAYRASVFKKKNWIVLSATLKLKKGDQKKLREISDSRKAYRKEKHPLEFPSAGSVFKNVDVKKIPKEFQQLFADKIKKDPFPIVPAAWFIIGAGLAGKKIGKAQISKKHSNYIVNLGGAKAKDILALLDFVKQKVKEKYDINLEPEVQFVG
ncbi:MAG: UDP-N-acetylmuramate dehydrogenase [Candidatus Staskawiczbacteria bacterium]|nr:UDP-N-acetylmuramate dehydrogenase [Candidatus Staskawiczbacteria bacterium]